MGLTKFHWSLLSILWFLRSRSSHPGGSQSCATDSQVDPSSWNTPPRRASWCPNSRQALVNGREPASHLVQGWDPGGARRDSVKGHVDAPEGSLGRQCGWPPMLTFTRGVTSELLVYEPSTNQREVVGKATEVRHPRYLSPIELSRPSPRDEPYGDCRESIKSCGCYETPAGTILRRALMDLERLTLDGKVRALRDLCVTAELSKILYNGYWFGPE
ncbi:hypothetical protein PTTG_27425 [Puccinia triticina 1-1 BBBD Race 1]|uniref:argininosuccinate synthase n=1 Tax=Puccinia triticina (isolate 1-1 / race 1 (BBBD)) TaxID=630390 RepID=A0A180GMD8_PUCT1|nr:hypothetical protein PTTG_27425 [Puccinia triticina 1-1 BBBD Race 1]